MVRKALIKHGYTIRSFSWVSCYFYHLIEPKDMSRSSWFLGYVCIIYCGQKQTPFILILTGKKLLNQALFQLSVQGLTIPCQQKAWTEQVLIFQQQILWATSESTIMGAQTRLSTQVWNHLLFPLSAQALVLFYCLLAEDNSISLISLLYLTCCFPCEQ